jgi:hypothetical protein
MEGLSSAYLGVWFNVGVDVAVLGLFAFPLIRGAAQMGSANSTAPRGKRLPAAQIKPVTAAIYKSCFSVDKLEPASN